jgi:hypothetical protein
MPPNVKAATVVSKEKKEGEKKKKDVRYVGIAEKKRTEI